MKTELSDEQLNIELCQWLGWEQCGPTICPPLCTGYPPGARGRNESVKALPSHPTDLNAMAIAEQKLENWQWSEYTMALRRVIQSECNKPECYAPGTERSQLIADFWFYHASARQRLIAMLRVVKPELFQ